MSRTPASPKVLAVLLLLVAAGCGTVPGVPPEPTATDTATVPTATAALPAPTDTAIAPTATEAPTETAVSAPLTPTQVIATPAADYVWKSVGLAGDGLTGIAILPQGTNIVVVAGPKGVWRSSYDYTQWQNLNAHLQGRTASAAIASSDVLYVTSNTGCASGAPATHLRSTDGGTTWEAIQQELMHIVTANGSVAYGLGCSTVFKTTDAGATWAELPSSALENYDPLSITAAPDGQTVYVAYASEGGTGRVMETTDGGQTWQEVTPKAGAGKEFHAPGNLTYVAALEGRPQDGGVYMTSDIGLWYLPLESTTWKLIVTGTEPPGLTYYTALFVDVAYTEEYNKPGPVIYLGKAKAGESGATGEGVVRSTDGGTSWKTVGQGLGERVVNGLALAPHDKAVQPGMVETLLAATSDGVWAIAMPPPFH